MKTTAISNIPTPTFKRAEGRSLADFGNLLHAEKILLAECAHGRMALIGDVVPADGFDPNKVVRASFLRFLLLGGDEQAPVHEHGVRLRGALIQDQLDLTNCHVPYGMTLSKCKFDQQILAIDAHISGPLYLFGSHLLQGLLADRLRCDSRVFFGDGFQSFAEVLLSGAQIGGDLACRGGQFASQEGNALSAECAVIKDNVFLDEPFKAIGTVRLSGAQIGGDLICSGGQFDPQKGNALSVEGSVVKGSVFMDERFKATGTVRLLGIQIGGSLTCNSGLFDPKEGGALFVDRGVVKGDIFLIDRFKATGEVRLSGAQIGGDLACRGGQFEPKEGDALVVDRAVIKGHVFLDDQFKATGTVRLMGAQIGGDLNCLGGQLATYVENSLLLQKITIQGGLLLRGLAAPVRVNATSAQIGSLVDDPIAWAKGSILDGLVYQSLSGAAPTDVAQRIAWLKQQSQGDLGEDEAKQGFRPQPWKQLQKVLREMGYEADARDVGIAFEDQLRTADRIGQITDANKAKDLIPVVRRLCLRGLHWVFGAWTGYGYRPMRLFVSMAVVWLVCACVYWWLALQPHSALGPTDPLVFQNPAYAACTAANKGNWFLCGPLPAEYTTFSPLAYSLDILLPLVDLGQEKAWGALVPTPEPKPFVELFSFSAAHFVRLLNWLEILCGWVASLLFVAIISGMSRRSEMEK